jgi:hypothetical protein
MSLLDRASPANQLDEEDDNCDDEQNVDVRADRMEADKSDEP